MILTKRSQSIDALRGLAALLVVFHHSYVPLIGVHVYDEFLSFFRRYGTLGVDLFFLLSGYCIHGAYWSAGEKFVAKNYMFRRWWRIYPPYFFALSLAVLLNLITNYYKWRMGHPITIDNFGPIQILTHLFLVHDLSQKTMLTISGPLWTIAVEMQYYLLYLVLRPLFYDRRGWVLLFLCSFTLYFMAWRAYYFSSTFQPLNPFCYWIEWVTGAFLVYLVKNKNETLKHKYWHALIFIAVGFLAGGSQYLHMNPHFGRILFAVSFAFLILFFLSLEKIWSYPGFKLLPQVGIFSYSVYLIHFLFMDRVRTFVIPEIHQGWPRFSVSILSIILCLLASYLFFIYFEKPFIKKAASIPKF